MKKITVLFFLAAATTVVQAYGAQNYNPGNMLLGIGAGVGNSDYIDGAIGFVANPSVEVITGTWHPGRVGIALGFAINSSVLISSVVTGSLAVMPVVHFTLARSFDWYAGVGFGLTLQGYTVRYGAGFQTGFNFLVQKAVMLNLGLELQGSNFFGVFAVKFRFGDVNVTQYNKK